MAFSAGFHGVPQEILDIILDYLDRDAPQLDDVTSLRVQPYLASAQDRTQPVRPQQAPHLKSLSLVSRGMRAAVFNRLFIRLQLIVVPPPRLASEPYYTLRNDLFDWIVELSRIAIFICKNNLGATVRSFILKVVDGQGHYRVDASDEANKDHSPESTIIGQHWLRLLDEIPLLSRLTIIAPPFCLGVIISVNISPYISEALHMPYHILSLGCGLESSLDSSATSAQVLQRRADEPGAIVTLLTAKMWTSMLLNEGSFVRHYIDQDYGWEDALLSSSSAIGYPKLPASFLANITSFQYIGIFPAPWSYEKLVFTLQAIPALQSFSFQIQPFGDPLYDTAQRTVVAFAGLQDTMQGIYELIFEQLIQEPAGEAETAFRELSHVQCLDQGSDALEMWDFITYDIEAIGWTRDPNIGGSLSKKSK